MVADSYEDVLLVAKLWSEGRVSWEVYENCATVWAQQNPERAKQIVEALRPVFGTDG